MFTTYLQVEVSGKHTTLETQFSSLLEIFIEEKCISSVAADKALNQYI